MRAHARVHTLKVQTPHCYSGGEHRCGKQAGKVEYIRTTRFIHL